MSNRIEFRLYGTRSFPFLWLNVSFILQNCDYTIISGARRKEERWDPSATENVQATGNFVAINKHHLCL